MLITIMANIFNTPEPSQPLSLLHCFLRLKKGKWFFGWHFYGRFLSISIIKAPIMAIAIIMATVEMAKYISVGGKLTIGYGDAVGAWPIAVK
jgi:hypothetical protein